MQSPSRVNYTLSESPQRHLIPTEKFKSPRSGGLFQMEKDKIPEGKIASPYISNIISPRSEFRERERGKIYIRDDLNSGINETDLSETWNCFENERRKQQHEISNIKNELSLIRSDKDSILRQNMNAFSKIQSEYKKEVEQKEEALKNQEIFEKMFSQKFEKDKQIDHLQEKLGMLENKSDSLSKGLVQVQKEIIASPLKYMQQEKLSKKTQKIPKKPKNTQIFRSQFHPILSPIFHTQIHNFPIYLNSKFTKFHLESISHFQTKPIL